MADIRWSPDSDGVFRSYSIFPLTLHTDCQPFVTGLDSKHTYPGMDHATHPGDQSSPSAQCSSSQQRPYRSRKVIPSRKVTCIRAEGSDRCSLCRNRGKSCTFYSRPAPKKRPTRNPSRTIYSQGSADAALQRFNGANLTNHIANRSHWHNSPGMLMDGYTYFYSGPSADQGSDLLRHLSFDERGRFGSASWRAWRVLPHVSDPVFFTIFPDRHLDAPPPMHSHNHIANVLRPYDKKLIKLFYLYIHPSYPIIEPREDFIARQNDNRQKSEALRSTPAPNCSQLWDEIFTALTLETRMPNTDTIKALLLYMQLPSRYVREPNRPGHWALNSMLVGVAQDIGLNIDPSSWDIPLSERKSRKILWWAVYAHDKWMAHWLGRPSHIDRNNWDVSSLALEDFSDDNSKLDVRNIISIRAFIAFTQLTSILDGLDIIPCCKSTAVFLRFAPRVLTSASVRTEYSILHN
ncbi:hypothetical protein BX600DRAFT_439820 [Xylariales sp. PMI_506]|nr:hypothetical protein BX600DRAFT_439820 [Xylariales sp. PMI_506]